MTNAKQDSTTQLGFLAVSATAAARIATFPIAPGFDATSAEADLQVCLARQGGNWQGHALSIDKTGRLRFKSVPAKK